ncbi:MAG: hypothetical protein WA733_08535 [Methylocystis sp.]
MVVTNDWRVKQPKRGAPYFLQISSMAQLGYRRSKTGSMWVLRRRLDDCGYVVETIGPADSDLSTTT